MLDIVDVKSFLYLGLVPFLVAGWQVYRGWYSPRPGALGPQLIVTVLFFVVYLLLLGFLPALGGTVVMILMWGIWGNAARKLESGRTQRNSNISLSSTEHSRQERKK